MKKFDDLIKAMESTRDAVWAKNSEQGHIAIMTFAVLFIRVYGHSEEMLSGFIPKLEEIRRLILAKDFTEANLHVLAILAWLRKVRDKLELGEPKHW